MYTAVSLRGLRGETCLDITTHYLDMLPEGHFIESYLGSDTILNLSNTLSTLSVSSSLLGVYGVYGISIGPLSQASSIKHR